MEIYVSNLPYQAEDSDLHALFEPYGKITRVKVVTDARTGQSRGFGFVTLHDAEEGQRAITELNGLDYNGRSLTVRESQPSANDMGRTRRGP